jgi:hypothetical protein
MGIRLKPSGKLTTRDGIAIKKGGHAHQPAKSGSTTETNARRFAVLHNKGNFIRNRTYIPRIQGDISA